MSSTTNRKPRSIRAHVFVASTVILTFTFMTACMFLLGLVYYFMVLGKSGSEYVGEGFQGIVVCTSITFIVTVLLSALLSYFLSKRVVRPLLAISDAARAISRGNWSIRITRDMQTEELQQVKAAFNTMCEANEAKLNELRSLTDDIAHDLRTPLTRLRNAAELALTGEVSRENLAGDVCEECNALLDLIRTSLDISFAANRLSEIPREEVDLVALARQSLEMFQPVAANHTLALTASLPDKPLPVSAHKVKLQQVLGNLLDNAVKFTPDGGSVSLTLETGPDALILRVSDSGCGIPPADREKIFKRFYRADSSRSLPGNGLGLALVRAIVTAYGGSISCTGNPGGGSVFTVALPRPA